MKLSSLLFLPFFLSGGEAFAPIILRSRSNYHHLASSSSLYSSQVSPDFNVVLKPSNDPEAFDSFKIGAARVHRYARDDSGGDSEYVMW